MESLISQKDRIEILKNYIGLSNDVKYISSEFKSISENPEGFMGEHTKLIINYEVCGIEKSHTFFVKNKPIKNKSQAELTETLGSFKREIFVYNSLIKELQKHGYDTSFAAKSYYTIPEQTLIMEDVTLNGFSITGKNEKLTMGHLKCALKSLALFHAAGFALQKTKSKQLNKNYSLGEEYNEYLSEVLFVQYIDQSMFSMKWWIGFYKTLDALINLMPHDTAYKQELKTLIKNAEIGKSFVTKTKINKTCCHGDLWSNNMLFKYKNNKPEQCILVDYQFCRYIYPCYDILLTIFCNTSSEFRKLHLDELYSFYYNFLTETLKDYGCNIDEIYPVEDFYKSIELVKVEALMQIVLTNTIVLLPKEILKKSVNEDDDGFSKVFFDNVDMAVEAYQKDEEYKRIIDDNIYEIRNALLKRFNICK